MAGNGSASKDFDLTRILEELKAGLAKAEATLQRLRDDPNTAPALRKRCEKIIATYRKQGALAEKLSRR